jgi:hypothetical protein
MQDKIHRLCILNLENIHIAFWGKMVEDRKCLDRVWHSLDPTLKTLSLEGSECLALISSEILTNSKDLVMKAPPTEFISSSLIKES